MWFDSDAPPSYNGEIRHEARQDDRLSSYGWLRHDGVGYGVQQLRDKDYNITLSMVGGGRGLSWPGCCRPYVRRQAWWPGAASCPQLLLEPALNLLPRAARTAGEAQRRAQRARRRLGRAHRSQPRARARRPAPAAPVPGVLHGRGELGAGAGGAGGGAAGGEGCSPGGRAKRSLTQQAPPPLPLPPPRRCPRRCPGRAAS
jgi:hypothetical protein